MAPLVVCDLDGTLLDSSGHTSATNRRGLEAAVEHGWTCVAATGRPSRCLDVIDTYRHLFTRVLASNGSEEQRDGETFRVVYPLDPDTAAHIIAAVKAEAGETAFAFEFGDSFGYEPRYAYWPATDHDPTATVARAEDLLRIGRPVAKLMVKTDRHTPDALVAAIASTAGSAVSVTHSNRHNTPGPVEVSHHAATKGQSVARTIAQLGFDAKDVIAFGDQLNDLTMLELAGSPYVVGDSMHPALKPFTRLDNQCCDAVGRRLLDLTGE